MAKRPDLASALRETAEGGPTRARAVPPVQATQSHAAPEAQQGTTPPAATPQRQRSRIGKVNVTGYFPPEVKTSLKLIQAQQPTRTIQDLLAEALNDLFAKYGVPESAPREHP